MKTPKLPTIPYGTTDGTLSVELRCTLSPKTRMLYADTFAHGSSASTTEDLWHRQVEFLFERLVDSWTINGVETKRQKDLLNRYRMASKDERDWLRGVFREHLTEWFPEMKAP